MDALGAFSVSVMVVEWDRLWKTTEVAVVVVAKARVLGIERERTVNLARRVVVATGDDKSRRETTKRRIVVKDIAYRNHLRLGKLREGVFFCRRFLIVVSAIGSSD